MLALVGKDIRVLLPIAGGTVAAMLSTLLLQDPLLGWMAYFAGAAALGVSVIGHEYTHRTMPVLLAQPLSRRRLYGAKLASLACVAWPLAALMMLFAEPVELQRGPLETQNAELVRAIPLAVMFTIAPLLTLLSGGALPGFVFTLGVPAVLLLVGQMIGEWRFARDLWPIDQVRVAREAVVAWGLLGLSIVAAPLGWWVFGRLQATDPSALAINPLFRLRAPTHRRRLQSRGLHLTGKELRLHRGALPISIIYSTIVVGLWSVVRDPFWAVEAYWLLTFGHAIVVAALAGAMTAAEERQFGTHASQLLLPLTVRTQWIVKCAVAIAVALTLALGLPFLLGQLAPAAIDPNIRRAVGVMSLENAAGVLVLTGVAIYLSSISSSAIRALLACGPVVLAGVLSISMMSSVVIRPAVRMLTAGLLDLWRRAGSPSDPLATLITGPSAMAIAAVLWLIVVLRVALSNYRAVDAGWHRAPRQLLAIAAAMLIALVLAAGFSAFVRLATVAAAGG